MSDELLPYYERELTELRQLSKEFSAKYPKIASRLSLSGEVSEDPHVERLIESFSLIAARIHRKLDDEFPQFTEALLDVLYPHYLRPFPSATIAKFSLDRNLDQLTGVARIRRGTVLNSKPVQGWPCKFCTCYPVDIWPIEVADCKIETALNARQAAAFPDTLGILTLTLKALSSQAPFTRLNFYRLRFFLHGESSLMYHLYHLLMSQVSGVIVRDGDNGDELARLGPECIAPAGFADDEALLGHDARSHAGYRLLSEYFCFPDKFLFFDITHLEAVARRATANTRHVGIEFHMRGLRETETNLRLMKAISGDNFQLNATPVINLFKQPGEPIRITHSRTDYDVVPDSRRPLALEVYSIDAVRRVSQTPGKEEIEEFHPFYSLHHHSRGDTNRLYWHATRKQSGRPGDDGTDFAISLVDLDFDPAVPAVETLSLDLTCTNRNLPALLPFGHPEGDLSLEGGCVAKVISMLRKPTSTLRPFYGKGALWRLVSHFTLNHLSIADCGKDALREMLGLYDLAESPFNRQQIEAIRNVTSRAVMARLPGNPFQSLVRGVEITLTLDEESFAGGGVYLFSSVLERFFGLYASANSFTQLRVISAHSQKELVKWPPRSGDIQLA